MFETKQKNISRKSRIQKPNVTQMKKIDLGGSEVIQRMMQSENSRDSLKNINNNVRGLPGGLRQKAEDISGMPMDDVKVHYNSDKPIQMRALAYTQGSDIHIGPNQEKYLPHELGHVVQQKQGRVNPTFQLKGINVNDNSDLEREADNMFTSSAPVTQMKPMDNNSQNESVVQRIKIRMYSAEGTEDAKLMEKGSKVNLPGLSEEQTGEKIVTILDKNTEKQSLFQKDPLKDFQGFTGNKIGKNEDIIFISHGGGSRDSYGNFKADRMHDYSPEKLVQIATMVEKPDDWQGRIILLGCAAGYISEQVAEKYYKKTKKPVTVMGPKKVVTLLERSGKFIMKTGKPVENNYEQTVTNNFNLVFNVVDELIRLLAGIYEDVSKDDLRERPNILNYGLDESIKKINNLYPELTRLNINSIPKMNVQGDIGWFKQVFINIPEFLQQLRRFHAMTKEEKEGGFWGGFKVTPTDALKMTIENFELGNIRKKLEDFMQKDPCRVKEEALDFNRPDMFFISRHKVNEQQQVKSPQQQNVPQGKQSINQNKVEKKPIQIEKIPTIILNGNERNRIISSMKNFYDNKNCKNIDKLLIDPVGKLFKQNKEIDINLFRANKKSLMECIQNLQTIITITDMAQSGYKVAQMPDCDILTNAEKMEVCYFINRVNLFFQDNTQQDEDICKIIAQKIKDSYSCVKQIMKCKKKLW